MFFAAALILTCSVFAVNAAASDTVTLAKLLDDPKAYSGQTVSIKADVVKFAAGIMGKNWIHLQDGSKGKNGQVIDLTVTMPTSQTAAKGATVTATGTVGTDVDFGAGYFYAVILEDATLK
jgi:hypothetical protein